MASAPKIIEVTVGAIVIRGRLLLAVQEIGIPLWCAPSLPLLFGNDFESTAIAAADKQAATAVKPIRTLTPGTFIETDVLGQALSHQVMIWVFCEYLGCTDSAPPKQMKRAWIEPTLMPVHPLLQPFITSWPSA